MVIFDRAVAKYHGYSKSSWKVGRKVSNALKLLCDWKFKQVPGYYEYLWQVQYKDVQYLIYVADIAGIWSSRWKKNVNKLQRNSMPYKVWFYSWMFKGSKEKLIYLFSHCPKSLLFHCRNCATGSSFTLYTYKPLIKGWKQLRKYNIYWFFTGEIALQSRSLLYTLLTRW